MGTLSSQDESATPDRILGFLNREQRVWLTRLMMSVRDGYGKDTAVYALAAGATSFRIPTKAVGAKIDRLEVTDGNGGWKELTKTTNENAEEDAAHGNAAAWFFLDNSIVFTGPISSATSVRVTFMRRRNKIVDSQYAREVSTFSTGSKTITLAGSESPDLFLTTATSYDVIQGNPHFDLLGASMSATRSGQVLTFTDDLPDDLAAGDYVSIAGETPIAMVPVELQDVLCYRALFCYLRSMGDPKAQQAKEDLEEMKNDALAILAPRAEGHNDFIINYDAPGWKG
jgi:hypothetical protein